MKFASMALGLGIAVALAPQAASAQNFLQGITGPDGAAITPDTDSLGRNLNPFAAASGADTFAQDNSLAGATTPGRPAAASGDSDNLNSLVTDDLADGSNSGN